MTRPSDTVAGFLVFSLFFAVTTLFVIVASIFWYVSPLGLGFAQWPTDADQRYHASLAYGLSYFVGIPMMVFGQIASAVLESRNKRALAYLVPSVAIVFFVVSVWFVFFFLEA